MSTIKEELRKCRDEINRIDDIILRMLEERIEMARKIGEIKKNAGIEISDLEREQVILSRLSSSTSINPKFVKRLFAFIIRYCKNEEGR